MSLVSRKGAGQLPLAEKAFAALAETQATSKEQTGVEEEEAEARGAGWTEELMVLIQQADPGVVPVAELAPETP